MITIKAYAKVNIFLKITGYENGYHTLLSRFMRVDDLYDTISLVPEICEDFTLESTKKYLTKYNSPMLETAEDLVKTAQKYDLDPLLLEQYEEL